jgi:beta-lactam-binding protein with PASTA domain
LGHVVDEILWYLKRVPVGGVLAAIVVFFLWFLSASPNAAHFVPEVQGHQVQEAVSIAAQHSFALRFVVRKGGGRAGTVVTQDPKPGTALAKNVPITAVVTEGVTQVKLPDIKGKTVDDVRHALQAAHVTPGVVTYKRDSKVAPDHVITTKPAPGTYVDVGSSVEIIASAP